MVALPIKWRLPNVKKRSQRLDSAGVLFSYAYRKALYAIPLITRDVGRFLPN